MTTLQARPTIYKGIQMRSRLEAGFAMWLDQRGALWEYEPHCFAGSDGQYLPDFLVRGVQFAWPPDLDTFDFYVEVKPVHPSHDDMCRWARILDENGHRAFLVVHADDHRRPLQIMADGGGARLEWIIGDGGLALACPDSGPWYGEWWKGQGA